MSSLITVPAIGATPQIAINPEGEKLKLDLLGAASIVTCVTDDTHRDIAIRVAGSIKAHLAAVEKERVALKEPFLTAGRMIDAAAKTHVTELDAELKRLNNLAGAYEAEKQRIAKKKADDDREAARIAEDALKKAEAITAKGEDLTDTQKAEVMEAQMDASEKAEAAQFSKQQADAKPTGAALRTEIEVTVHDIKALYAKEPACVKLTADISMIKAFHKAGRELPGVTITERPVFATRASR